MKKRDLIQIIEKGKYECVFVSPHQDDVILSCGSLLRGLTGKVSITVINVFTAAHKKPYTFSAKRFLSYSNGYSDARELYKEREKEDKEVFSQLAIKPINLGLEDALFRRRNKRTIIGNIIPEFDHLYLTYQWHIIKSVAANDPAILQLKKRLESFKKKKTLIFAPYGIGNHADHVIVRKVCEQLFDTYILYSDFPYNMRLNNYGKTLADGETYRLDPNIGEKTKLIKGYKTQFNGLFPNGVPDHQEVYFSNKKL